MKLNKEELRGTKSVFGFTLKQYAKSKSNRIMVTILIILALVSVPVTSFILGDDRKKEDSSAFSKVYIDNKTDYEINIQSLSMAEGWGKTEFEKSTLDESSISEKLLENEAAVGIAFDQEKNSYVINTYTADETGVSEDELYNLGNLILGKFNESRYKAIGATDKQLSTVMSSYNVGSMSMKEYTNKDKGPGMGTVFTVQYAYSIAVFLLCLFSTIYVIYAIIEEKNSKLVELLMVSVKPLALILGKILAVMLYTFTTTIIVLAAFGLSYLAGGMLTGTEKVGQFLADMGITPSVINISPMTIVIALVSLALGYLTISIIGGIAGTCCSTMEDMQSANFSVVLVVMFGYIVSAIAVPLTNDAGSTLAAIIASLVPIVSIFCAPVQYVCGNISIYILLLSWLIQIGLIVLLAVFCSKVYEGLIIHKGSSVKLKELLSMAGLKKAKEAR